MNPVIVFSKGSGVNALSIIRSMGRRGIKVILVLSSKGQSLASRSKYCSQTIYLPEESSSAFGNVLRSILQQESSKPVLMCDSDETSHIAAACFREFRDKIHFFQDLERFDLLQDKQFQTENAVAAGLLAPQSWYPKNWKEFQAIAVGSGRDVILKPNPVFYQDNAPFKVVRATNIIQAEEKLRQYVDQPEGMIVQEFVDGLDEHMWEALGYRSYQGEIIGMVTMSKVKQSGSGAGGVAIIGKTKKCLELEHLAKKYLEQVGYKGAFDLEFKFCTKRQKFIFIEANYRTARFHVVGRRCGADIPAMGYADLTGIPITTQKMKQESVWFYDIKGCLQTLRKTKEKAIKGSMAMHMALAPFRSKEWLVHAWDDLNPTLKAAQEFGSQIIASLKRRFKSIYNFTVERRTKNARPI